MSNKDKINVIKYQKMFNYPIKEVMYLVLNFNKLIEDNYCNEDELDNYMEWHLGDAD